MKICYKKYFLQVKNFFLVFNEFYGINPIEIRCSNSSSSTRLAVDEAA